MRIDLEASLRADVEQAEKDASRLRQLVNWHRHTLRLIYGEISPSAVAGDERWAAANLTNIARHLQDREPWLGDESDD